MSRWKKGQLDRLFSYGELERLLFLIISSTCDLRITRKAGQRVRDLLQPVLGAPKNLEPLGICGWGPNLEPDQSTKLAAYVSDQIDTRRQKQVHRSVSWCHDASCWCHFPRSEGKETPESSQSTSESNHPGVKAEPVAVPPSEPVAAPQAGGAGCEAKDLFNAVSSTGNEHVLN